MRLAKIAWGLCQSLPHRSTKRIGAADMDPVKALISDVATHQAPADPSVRQDALDSIAAT
jgi:hypothetical protein